MAVPKLLYLNVAFPNIYPIHSTLRTENKSCLQPLNSQPEPQLNWNFVPRLPLSCCV